MARATFISATAVARKLGRPTDQRPKDRPLIETTVHKTRWTSAETRHLFIRFELSNFLPRTWPCSLRSW